MRRRGPQQRRAVAEIPWPGEDQPDEHAQGCRARAEKRREFSIGNQRLGLGRARHVERIEGQ